MKGSISPVVVVSIDGLAPRAITTATMPALTGLARSGASCYTARTVTPSVTLPAHMSMLRGVEPDVHGVLDNEPRAPRGEPRSFLKAVRQGGLRTASIISWPPMEAVVEADGADTRIVVDAGYDARTDATVARTACGLVSDHDLTFVYFIGPDLAGHASGWDSPEYAEAVAAVDDHLATLIRSVEADASILVTTDHGGLGTSHGEGRPEDVETFVVLRSPRVAATAGWRAASILDVAPTVAALCGIAPPAEWTGTSLLGLEEPLIDWLVRMLAEMEAHTYGERIDMLEHALQTAALARIEGGSPDLVLAGLLHDIGHTLGQAGAWGLPDHAEVGARALQAVLPPAIVEPIRLHVAAKRHRVTVDPAYAAHLSEASTMSLAEQGGPFTAAEIAEHEARPFAAAATRLRDWDDRGKVEGLEIAPLDAYRDVLLQALAQQHPAPFPGRWARDACRCAECRDRENGQHLLDVSDLDDWTVTDVDTAGPTVFATVTDGSGRRHRCEIPLRSFVSGVGERVTTWDAGHALTLTSAATQGHDAPLDRFLIDLDERGIALVRGLSTEPATVLDFAERVGFVRETNYGRLFDVIAAPRPINLAYTPVALPLHTDNPYRDPCPTVQILHCLSAAPGGGVSRFSDGFAAAARLRELHPDAFATLSSTPVTFRFRGDGIDLEASRPIIDTGPCGTVRAVSVNHRSMEAPPPAPGVEAFYRAYRLFRDLVDHPEAVIELTLAPGDLIAFDNRRVLHGRSAFPAGHIRHLQGCYIDIDAVRSASRLLRASH